MASHVFVPCDDCKRLMVVNTQPDVPRGVTFTYFSRKALSKMRVICSSCSKSNKKGN